MIDNTKLDELLALADRLHVPRSRWIACQSVVQMDCADGHSFCVVETRKPEVASYIAACSPETIRALIEEVKALRQEVKALKKRIVCERCGIISVQDSIFKGIEKICEQCATKISGRKRRRESD